MYLIRTLRQLETALDSLDSDALARAINTLIDQVGPTSALALARALLAERGMLRDTPLRAAATAIYA